MISASGGTDPLLGFTSGLHWVPILCIGLGQHWRYITLYNIPLYMRIAQIQKIQLHPVHTGTRPVHSFL